MLRLEPSIVIAVGLFTVAALSILRALVSYSQFTCVPFTSDRFGVLLLRCERANLSFFLLDLLLVLKTLNIYPIVHSKMASYILHSQSFRPLWRTLRILSRSLPVPRNRSTWSEVEGGRDSPLALKALHSSCISPLHNTLQSFRRKEEWSWRLGG